MLIKTLKKNSTVMLPFMHSLHARATEHTHVACADQELQKCCLDPNKRLLVALVCAVSFILPYLRNPQYFSDGIQSKM